MDPVVPIGRDSYLPSPPLRRITFAEVEAGKVYYVKHREHLGPGWPQRSEWLLAMIETVTPQTVFSRSVWYLERGWRRRGVGFSANLAEIDTGNEGRDYHHFYVPQEPVGDPTAAASAAPLAAAGGAGAAAAADPAPNNTGDPVAPRRMPSRKRKNSRRSSRTNRSRRTRRKY
jgi:hypothetical protein